MIRKLLSALRRRQAANLYQSAVAVFRQSLEQLDKAYDVLNDEVIQAIIYEENLRADIETSKAGRSVLELELNGIMAQKEKVEKVLA